MSCGLVQFGQRGIQVAGHALRHEPGEQRIAGSRQAADTGGVGADTGPDNVEAAAGLIKPLSGQIRWHGEPIDAIPPHRRAAKGLCLIPEGRGIFPTLSVRENLRMQIRADEPNPPEAMDRALAAFSILGDRLNVAAGNLSGGQQQMVALARAFISRPSVILVDEASMGLAPLVVDAIFKALEILASSGVAMLIVEQYISRALALADQLVLLNKGKVTYSGPKSGLAEDSIWSSYLGTDPSTESAAPVQGPPART